MIYKIKSILHDKANIVEELNKSESSTLISNVYQFW